MEEVTTLAFYIGLKEAIGLLVTIVIGAATGAWFLSGRLSSMEAKIEGFGSRITGLEGRLNNAFSSASPISLQPAAVQALDESGLKEWIDANKPWLMEMSAAINDLKNPYDIQEAAFKLFDEVALGEMEGELKITAFNRGWSMETMRRIGGIYFRDICLKEKGFATEDLDI